MEKFTIKVSFAEKADAIKCHELFSWQLEKEEKLDVNKYELAFIRDENINHIEIIKKLEKEFFQLSKIPLWSLVVLPVITIIYLTAFMILFLTKSLELSKLYKSIVLSVPPAVLLSITMGLTFIRNKHIQKYIINHDERYRIYETKIKGIKDAN